MKRGGKKSRCSHSIKAFLIDFQQSYDPTMEDRGYNKSAFTSESGFLARALRWFKHDHTYARTKAKEVIGDDSVQAESKEG